MNDFQDTKQTTVKTISREMTTAIMNRCLSWPVAANAFIEKFEGPREVLYLQGYSGTKRTSAAG